MKVEPFKAESWHKSNAALGTAVQIRCRSSLWSLGSVDINEIGSSVIHLPPRAVTSDGSLSDERAKVIQVEVKIADPSENCSIVVVIWEVGGEFSFANQLLIIPFVCLRVPTYDHRFSFSFI